MTAVAEWWHAVVRGCVLMSSRASRADLSVTLPAMVPNPTRPK